MTVSTDIIEATKRKIAERQKGGIQNGGQSKEAFTGKAQT